MDIQLDKKTIRRRIAWRVAREMNNGDVVNLGIGLPAMVADETDPSVEILLQAENGLLGIGKLIKEENAQSDCVNAGGQPIRAIKGACTFNSADSFSIIRGGHVDATVLGALEVDEKGSLANWIIPGKMVPGMGGAMDLVVGAKKVIVAMEHTVKGKPKLLKKCTLPYTAVNQVNLIVTEMGVINITDKGMELTEIAPEFSIQDVQNATEAKLVISPNLKTMAIPD